MSGLEGGGWYAFTERLLRFNLTVFSGDQIAVYSELCYHTALHGVSFHPFENMVAFCACGQNQPVHVYLYDRKGLCFGKKY